MSNKKKVQALDDTERNTKATSSKKKGEKFELRAKRVTFFIHPGLYKAFEEIREITEKEMGKKRGWKYRIFNEYVRNWLQGTKDSELATYRGIKKVTDDYLLCTFYLDNDLITNLENTIKYITGSDIIKRGYKTEIINEVMWRIVRGEAHRLGRDFIEDNEIIELLEETKRK